MDLAVAAVALPEVLRDGVVGVLPDDVLDALPTHLDLLDAVSTGGPAGEIDRLEALRVLDLRLARHEHVVLQALLDVGGGDVPRPTGPPTAVPDAHRPGPGPMGQTVPRT
jgi:hypothetical protein